MTLATSFKCAVCGAIKARAQFLRRFKMRLIVNPECRACFETALLRDTSGREIQRALVRHKINEIEARALRAQLATLREDREKTRRAKISAKIARLHTDRRRYGKDLPKEQTRREKIAAALTGRKRGPYVKAKDRI